MFHTIYDKRQILNPNLGLGSVLPAPDELHLPEASPAIVGQEAELKLEELYESNGFERQAMNALQPMVTERSLLIPTVLNRALSEAYNRLSSSKNANVRRFVREDLHELLSNRELLSSYLGMMVSG